MKDHPLFHSIWICENALLVLSIGCLLCALYWEHSTREYLRGFSDAVIPAASSKVEKVQAILDWMQSGSARRTGPARGLFPVRNPAETLNYRSLLQVCGSATNAFINLAMTKGIPVRRLLLLNAQDGTNHVDAEVLLDGRWVVVDPTFRRIMRDARGALLTAQQLKEPVLLKAATLGLANYQPEYSFANTAHLHLSRFGSLGLTVGRIGDSIFPGWDASAFMTLLVERDSFAACVLSIALVIFFLLVRVVLGWYADRHLGIDRIRFVERLRRSSAAFLRQAN